MARTMLVPSREVKWGRRNLRFEKVCFQSFCFAARDKKVSRKKNAAWIAVRKVARWNGPSVAAGRFGSFQACPRPPFWTPWEGTKKGPNFSILLVVAWNRVVLM
jgi:hypothetical protein